MNILLNIILLSTILLSISLMSMELPTTHNFDQEAQRLMNICWSAEDNFNEEATHQLIALISKASYIIENFSDVNAKDLIETCDNKAVELIKKRADPNTPVTSGSTFSGPDEFVLHAAIRMCLFETHKTLIKYGADIEKRQTLTGNTPLLCALSFKKRTAAVNDLTEKKASIKACSNNGRTPLHWAVIYNNHTLVDHFINKGALINKKDIFGFTPLHCIYFQENWSPLDTNILCTLLEAGANPNIKDVIDATLLHKLVAKICSNTVHSLLKEGTGNSQLTILANKVTLKTITDPAYENNNSIYTYALCRLLDLHRQQKNPEQWAQIVVNRYYNEN